MYISGGSGLIRYLALASLFPSCPPLHRGGLYSLYSIAHAQFVWDLKTEPAYMQLFEEIWGTKELLGEFTTRPGSTTISSKG